VVYLKICVDPGHGGRTTGAVGKFSIEKNVNLKLGLMLQKELEKVGMDVVMTRTSDLYVSLQGRCDIANKANCDYFVSIHCNGFHDPSANGTSTYHYPGSSKGAKLAAAIQEASVKYNKNRDRGVKTAAFYVLKYTKMPAVLLETAFITNVNEEKMLNDPKWQEGYVKVIAGTIGEFVGISPKEPPKAAEKHPIADLKRATASQMESFLHKVNPDAPYLAEKYLAIGYEEGIRGDIAFAQAIKETGYFRFTGVVKKEQNNFAGLGVTGPGERGASFNTPEEGIRAHIQHLKAYANTEPLKTPLVDPRFHLVERGTAPNWEDLNGKWAVPGEGYGESVIDIWKRILGEEE